MMTIQWIYLAIIFAVVFGVTLIVVMQIAPNRIKARLEKVVQPESGLESESAPWVETITRVGAPLARLSVPAEGWENSPLRTRFMNAGYRGSAPAPLYFIAKTFLAVLLPGIAFLYIGLSGTIISTELYLAWLLSLAGIGYYLPNIVLSSKIDARQREVFESFPDAIDLMLVCIEAGLGIDAALAKIAEEIQIKSKVLSEELHLVNLELRAGNSKEKALRNLALRTGVKEVDSLVSMLMQAERFGTGIGESLRVHADDLRTKRRLRAEEAAAKIPLKLLFPLIFCIFPSLLLILLGPAFISIYRTLLPAFAGMQ